MEKAFPSRWGGGMSTTVKISHKRLVSLVHLVSALNADRVVVLMDVTVDSGRMSLANELSVYKLNTAFSHARNTCFQVRFCRAGTKESRPRLTEIWRFLGSATGSKAIALLSSLSFSVTDAGTNLPRAWQP